MDQNTIRHLLTAPHIDIPNGYLYITKPAADLLGIINEFSTFAEVWDDMQLLNRNNYFVSLTYFPPKNMITYEIKGHGFLKEKK